MSTHREEPGPSPSDVEHAVARLRSPHDGDLALLDVIACGHRAIPALRELLFEREPSGLYEVRRRTVEALAHLRAYDVLFDFLGAQRNIVDPVERLGEDAVINAVARALANVHLDEVFELLLRLARRPCLSGVIAALGHFNRPEAIPVLVDALAEDESRPVAEAALIEFGLSARAALMRVAYPFRSTTEPESESCRRQRSSARKLLNEIDVVRES